MGVLTSIEGSNPSFSARRGGRAVECGGLENRFGRFRPTRVQIPPPPLLTSRPQPCRDEPASGGRAGLCPAGASQRGAKALRQEGAHGGNPVSPVLRAVECGGLENRFGRFRPTRVQIPPPPPSSLTPASRRPSQRSP